MFNFKIITPEKVVFSDEIDQVSLMTASGEITIMPHHIPLVSVLKTGELKYKKAGQEFLAAVAGGFVEVKNDGNVVVLADAAEYAHEIDLTRAEAAKVKAEKLMQSARELDSVEYATMQAALEKALSRIRIGNKYRKLPPK